MEKLKTKLTKNIVAAFMLAGLAVTSCQEMNMENSENCFSKEFVYPTDIVSPESAKINEQLSINLKVTLKNSCGSFGGFLAKSDSLSQKFNIETIAAYRGCTCTQSASVVDTAYTFTPTVVGTYQFNFKNGDSSYDSKTVIVTE